MEHIKTLDELADGAAARISGVRVSRSIKRRMQDIGFLDGVVIRCLFHSPAGEPAAFMINGAVIALRREEMCRIEIQSIEQSAGVMEAADCMMWG